MRRISLTLISKQSRSFPHLQLSISSRGIRWGTNIVSSQNVPAVIRPHLRITLPTIPKCSVHIANVEAYVLVSWKNLFTLCFVEIIQPFNLTKCKEKFSIPPFEGKMYFLLAVLVL